MYIHEKKSFLNLELCAEIGNEWKKKERKRTKERKKKKERTKE